ncbi:unnamed protein product [Anisakis simplex]|uniref:Probable G-protein coupled receptor (inferred by orthology to a C. elegans protein) n=1 Tax=Anisakis simplex TaxID=6269 RepID=A0A158PN35_ANISI|nr:unnamed protein product [Anisakis simplex]
MASEYVSVLIGGMYIVIGIIGFILNLATVLMIATNRVYRLSAYTLMANLAFADTVMMLVAGVICGGSLIKLSSKIIPMNIQDALNSSTSIESEALSLLQIAAWTAGMVSYAFLGLNRCVAICFYGTKAKSLNRVSVAIFGSIITWLIGIITACIGTIPDPLMGIRRDMWTARLTFQFFYPSLICTVSSVVYFTKPFLIHLLTEWQFVLLHIVWLCNHMCNPFIYAYFNERMRMSYRNWLTCATLRYIISKKRKQMGFVGGRRLNASATNGLIHLLWLQQFLFRRSVGANARANRMSTRSGRITSDGNFVRNSLQMQSRDFEQLCEFMVRVNPSYDSSEGWRESSDEEEEQSNIEAHCTHNQPIQEPRSIVLGLGRQTVQHWAQFAKKASI